MSKPTCLLFVTVSALAAGSVSCTLGAVERPGHEDGGAHVDSGPHRGAEFLAVGGWSQATMATLVDTDTLDLVAASDDLRFDISGGFSVTFSFRPMIPSGASIVSIHVGAEHHEETGFSGPLSFAAGTGSAESPSIIAREMPAPNIGVAQEATFFWDVTRDFSSAAMVNDLQFRFANEDGSGKILRLDRIFLHIDHR